MAETESAMTRMNDFWMDLQEWDWPGRGILILGPSRDRDRTGFHAEIFLPSDEFVSNGERKSQSNRFFEISG